MELNHIREEIDQIDKKLRKLFLQRMELSNQVAETKMRTRAEVYVREREQEILHARTEGVREDFLPECRAFFEQMMEISRTYQYSKMAEENALLKDLPKEESHIKLCFFCSEGSRQLSVFLNAAVLAGLTLVKIEAKQKTDGVNCSVRLSGDFSLDLSRAVVLQILKENRTASYTLILQQDVVQ